MEIYEKKLIVLNKPPFCNIGYKGTVKIVRLNSTLTITVDLLTSSVKTNNLVWLFSANNNYILENFSNSFRFSKVLPTTFDFLSGASFILYDSVLKDVLSYGEYGTPKVNLNNYKEYLLLEDTICEYNDELLATEDYYKLENESLRDQTKSLGTTNQEEEVNKGKKSDLNFNEKDFSFIKDNCHYKQINEKLNSILSNHPKIEELNNIIKDSTFVKIRYDETRYYVVGVIYKNSKPFTLAYGVKGKYDETPSGFDDGKFVPLSPFNLMGDGYYLIFQNLSDDKNHFNLKSH